MTAFILFKRTVRTSCSSALQMASMTVLIIGETGVGKGLATWTLHALSAHSDGPFIQVSCGALHGTLIDSELFGHEKGAFTGAVSQRLGRVVELPRLSV